MTRKFPSQQQTNKREWVVFYYLHQCQVPYLPPGRRMWQIHGTSCEPQNSKLQGKKRGIETKWWEESSKEKINTLTDGKDRQKKKKESETWLKSSVLSLTGTFTDSKRRCRFDNTMSDWSKWLMSGLGSVMFPNGQFCLQAGCSYCSVPLLYLHDRS